MNHKQLLSILLLLPLTLGARAQWQVGARVGWLYDQPVVNKQYAYTRNYTAYSGAVIGVPVQYNFFDWLGLIAEPELQFRQSRYTLSTWYAEAKKDLTLDIPIMVQFSFGGSKVRGFVNLGGYVGGWLDEWQHKANAMGSAVGWSTESRNFTSQDNRFDGGLVGGLGIRIFNQRRYNLTLEYRYYYGLSSRQKTHTDGSSYGFYDNLQTITLGINFDVTKKKGVSK